MWKKIVITLCMLLTVIGAILILILDVSAIVEGNATGLEIFGLSVATLSVAASVFVVFWAYKRVKAQS